MLEVKKRTTTITEITITGDMLIDDERVAWLTADLMPNHDPIINMKIADMEKYHENFESAQTDEKEFEAYVCESDKVAMTQSEEITDVFNPDDEPKDDESDEDDEPDDEDDKTGAGSEETIIP